MVEDTDPAAQIVLTSANFGTFPMANGLSRLATRFYGHDDDSERLAARLDRPIEAAEAADLGLVTAALDDIDFEDEVRIVLEERCSLSPDALTGLEANCRFAGPETLETKILFGLAHRLAELDFSRPNAAARVCSADPVRHRAQGRLRLEAGMRCAPTNEDKIPSNVGLADDRRLQRALESWQPAVRDLVGGYGAADPHRGRLPAHGDQRGPGGLGRTSATYRCPTTGGASSWPSGIGPADRVRRAQGRACLAAAAR